MAYFNELDKLKQGDKIELTYNNKTYTYIVNTVWEEDKTGYIHINKSNKKQLVLTTCSPNNTNKQLIVNSTLTT